MNERYTSKKQLNQYTGVEKNLFRKYFAEKFIKLLFQTCCSLKMNNTANTKRPIAPPGFEILNEECLKIYPDQTNPLQVTTVLKYW